MFPRFKERIQELETKKAAAEAEKKVLEDKYKAAEALAKEAKEKQDKIFEGDHLDHFNTQSGLYCNTGPLSSRRNCQRKTEEGDGGQGQSSL